jgi:hypothetical protein
MIVLLDESGDLGWCFSSPYRQGGSSRYLSMTMMFLPKEYKEQPKDIIRFLYKKFGWTKEKKASDVTLNQKIIFSTKAAELLRNNKEIKIDVITVKKENVEEHIRTDSNKLYNYMVSLVVPEYVTTYEKVDFIPDERSIKVKSGNSLADYLQVKLWFDCKCKTILINKPTVSRLNYNLQFVDWVSNCVWINFEDKISQPFTILSPFIKHRPLFFA